MPPSKLFQAGLLALIWIGTSAASQTPEGRIQEWKNRIEAQRAAREARQSKAPEAKSPDPRPRVPTELRALPGAIFSLLMDGRLSPEVGPFTQPSFEDRGLTTSYPQAVDWARKNAGAFAWIRRFPELARLAFEKPEGVQFEVGHPEVVAWSTTHPREAVRSEQYALGVPVLEGKFGNRPLDHARSQGYPEEFLPPESRVAAQVEAGPSPEAAGVGAIPSPQVPSASIPVEAAPQPASPPVRVEANPLPPQPPVVAAAPLDPPPSQRFQVFAKVQERPGPAPKVQTTSLGIHLPRRPLRLPLLVGFRR